MLARADEQFGGVWREVTIPASTALAIMLPPHAGEPCRGDQLTLVGPAGASVAEAAAALAALGDAYTRNNASCAERLAFAREAAFSAIVVTPAPLDWEEYARVGHSASALYCVDGFHRLVSWAAAGRIGPGAWLPALLAGALPATSDLEYVRGPETGR